MFLVKLKAHVNKSFKKIRIRPTKLRPSGADALINQRNKLLKHGDVDKIDLLDAQIAKTIAEEGRIKASMFRKFCNPNRSTVLSEMWQLKKNLKKPTSLPSAKYQYQGKIVTEPKELTHLIREEYGKIRLRKRPCHPDNKINKPVRNKLLQLKLLMAKQRKTEKFKMTDLEKVLEGLKLNKARGPDGLSRTIFKKSIIGTDLKESLLQMLNKLKDAGKVPDFMRKAIVTTIPKKGTKLKLENERGIFIVSTIRSG